MPGMIHKRSVRDHRMRRPRPNRRWQRRRRPGMRREGSRREWRRRQQRPHTMQGHTGQTDDVNTGADEYTPTDRMRMRGERRQMRRMERRYIRTHGLRLFCAAMDHYECDDHEVPDSLVMECDRFSSEPEVEPSSDIVV